MIKSKLFVLLSFFPCLPAVAQNYTIKYTVDGQGSYVVYVSPNAIRKETKGVFDVIDRVDRGTLISIDHSKRSYSEVPIQAIKAALESKTQPAAMNARQRELLQRMGTESKIEKVGSGVTILGYPTDHYLIRGPMMDAEVWVTQALQFPPAYYRDFNVLNGVSTPFGNWNKVMDLHGVVLKRVVTMHNVATRISEIATSIDKSPIPASMFDPPAGYNKKATR